jgi:hypothetical protein
MTALIEARTLWASLATTLNDATEVTYTIELARSLCASDLPAMDESFLVDVSKYLDPSNALAEFKLEFEAYVISFCATTNSALQWLHYGRSGSGCAVAFEPDKFEVGPFSIVRVIYDVAKQREFIIDLLASVFDVLKEAQKRLSAENAGKVAKLAAHIAAQCIWAGGATLKDPAFSHEQEWRLLTFEAIGPDGRMEIGTPLRTEFRSVATRVVPYKKFRFLPEALTELVLGNTVEMRADDAGLRTLFREALERTVPVTRSRVRVRR